MNAVAATFDGAKDLSIEAKSLTPVYNTMQHAGLLSLLVIFILPLEFFCQDLQFGWNGEKHRKPKGERADNEEKGNPFTDPTACARSTACSLCRRGCDRKESGKKQAEGRRGKKIYVTDLGKLSEIQFDVGNGEIQLVKEDGTWYDKNDKRFSIAQSYPKRWKKHSGSLGAERKPGRGGFSGSIWSGGSMYTVVLTDQDGNETTLYFGM